VCGAGPGRTNSSWKRRYARSAFEATSNPVVCKLDGLLEAFGVLDLSFGGWYLAVMEILLGWRFSAEFCGVPVQLFGDGEVKRKQEYATDSWAHRGMQCKLCVGGGRGRPEESKVRIGLGERRAEVVWQEKRARGSGPDEKQRAAVADQAASAVLSRRRRYGVVECKWCAALSDTERKGVEREAMMPQAVQARSELKRDEGISNCNVYCGGGELVDSSKALNRK
jgi:hypothetical protein